MSDLKIVTIGPEALANYGIAARYLNREKPIHSAVVAIMDPTGDIIALDVMDQDDNILIERDLSNFPGEGVSGEDSLVADIARAARSIITGNPASLTLLNKQPNQKDQ